MTFTQTSEKILSVQRGRTKKNCQARIGKDMNSSMLANHDNICMYIYILEEATKIQLLVSKEGGKNCRACIDQHLNSSTSYQS